MVLSMVWIGKSDFLDLTRPTFTGDLGLDRVLAIATEQVRERLESDEQLRSDGFFSEKSSARSDAGSREKKSR